MNADGWGAGFFAAGRPEPARGRSGLAGELDPQTWPSV
jgi:hypothetical protein